MTDITILIKVRAPDFCFFGRNQRSNHRSHSVSVDVVSAAHSISLNFLIYSIDFSNLCNTDLSLADYKFALSDIYLRVRNAVKVSKSLVPAYSSFIIKDRHILLAKFLANTFVDVCFKLISCYIFV